MPSVRLDTLIPYFGIYIKSPFECMCTILDWDNGDILFRWASAEA
jgi:hypothetical protein